MCDDVPYDDILLKACKKHSISIAALCNIVKNTCFGALSQVSFFTGFADCFEMRVIYIMFITCWVKTCIFLQIFCCIAMSPCSRILKACKNTSFLSRPFSKLCEIHVPPPLTCGKCGKIRARPLNLNSKYGNLCISTPSIRALMLDPKLHLRNLLRITPGRQEAKMSKF